MKISVRSNNKKTVQIKIIPLHHKMQLNPKIYRTCLDSALGEGKREGNHYRNVKRRTEFEKKTGMV